eukprot:TRINITY_DN41417_c0_g1_i1.p1 TRINITY_DN41417_c0_g1~~TRINITY_DN41417_c0_g1_i1.p1  ORF type:complete len:282 (-),score=61.76 TRINITY_DN41417_c0_g1_i1:68-871(-)
MAALETGVWRQRRSIHDGTFWYENAETGEKSEVYPPAKTSEELRDLVLRATFAAADKDGSGGLNKAELGVVLRRMNPKMDRSMVDQYFQAMDKNRDSNISFEEFQAWLQSEHNAEMASALADATMGADGSSIKATFRIWDKDASGSLSKTELQELLAKISPKLSKRHVQEMVERVAQAMDTGGATTGPDGKIDYQEFISFIFGPPAEGVTASTAPTSEQAALPEGWEAVLDPASGHTYYFNTTTGESTWTHPASASTPVAFGTIPAK